MNWTVKILILVTFLIPSSIFGQRNCDYHKKQKEESLYKTGKLKSETIYKRTRKVVGIGGHESYCIKRVFRITEYDSLGTQKSKLVYKKHTEGGYGGSRFKKEKTFDSNNRIIRKEVRGRFWGFQREGFFKIFFSNEKWINIIKSSKVTYYKYDNGKRLKTTKKYNIGRGKYQEYHKDLKIPPL